MRTPVSVPGKILLFLVIFLLSVVVAIVLILFNLDWILWIGGSLYALFETALYVDEKIPSDEDRM